ncbi:hypothetical protein E1263_32415 [Kribbella antibiotica]|uniref:Uncharacterized protein n=1 Tax=Kribbella antibiotica TaxID=190195 RepID=A0A4R4YZE1_9ACTN|nr:phosphotransferase [Kribbella antibiotica]TDD49102.1 hypothetical protein E1263_32415 [Kribbella antibiotica]
MPLEPWLVEWCTQKLGAQPVEVLLEASAVSEVWGLRLDDGREVVVKRRPDASRRAATCLAVHQAVVEAGLPCARPLTDISIVNGLAVRAEEWRPGGEVAPGNDPRTAERSARLYAAAMRVTAGLQLTPPLPNPEWVHWDHNGPGEWPPNPLHDTRPGANELPPDLVAIAIRTRQRLLNTNLRNVLGHADWEAQNLRWNGETPYLIHDWDSVAWLPEAALIGAAAGAFASNQTPTLAPLASSEAFLNVFPHLTPDELEVAWAASLWPALHNARAEILWNQPPVALTALREQAEARLHRAGVQTDC